MAGGCFPTVPRTQHLPRASAPDRGLHLHAAVSDTMREGTWAGLEAALSAAGLGCWVRPGGSPSHPQQTAPLPNLEGWVRRLQTGPALQTSPWGHPGSWASLPCPPSLGSSVQPRPPGPTRSPSSGADRMSAGHAWGPVVSEGPVAPCAAPAQLLALGVRLLPGAPRGAKLPCLHCPGAQPMGAASGPWRGCAPGVWPAVFETLRTRP